MPAYFRKRSELFTVSAFIGGATSAVTYRFHADQIRSYFDVFLFHGVLDAILIFAYLLPSLLMYLVLYLANRLLIRLLGQFEFVEQRKMVIKNLLECAVSQKPLRVDPTDLLNEAAWVSLEQYWS